MRIIRSGGGGVQAETRTTHEEEREHWSYTVPALRHVLKVCGDRLIYDTTDHLLLIEHDGERTVYKGDAERVARARWAEMQRNEWNKPWRPGTNTLRDMATYVGMENRQDGDGSEWLQAMLHYLGNRSTGSILTATLLIGNLPRTILKDHENPGSLSSQDPRVQCAQRAFTMAGWVQGSYRVPNVGPRKGAWKKP